MSDLSKTAKALLETIVAAGKNGTFADPKRLSPLVKAGMVEVREDHTDDKGRVAVRATADGEQMIQAETEASAPEHTDTTTAEEKTMSKVSSIASNVTIPPATRSTRASKYPVDGLEVNQSFFVAADGSVSELAKTINGVVHNANKRYSEPTGEMVTIKRGKRAGEQAPERRQTRRFTSRRIADGAPWGEEYAGVAGVAVFRLPLE